MRTSGFSAFNKVIAKLKVMCSLIRYFSYTQNVVLNYDQTLINDKIL